MKYGIIVLLAATLITGCATTSPKPDPCQDVPSRLADLISRHQQLDRYFNTPAYHYEAQWLITDYEKLVNECPDHEEAAAMAARSIGNIRMSQEWIDQALEWYDRVVVDFPLQKWEVVQALKSAADGLYDANRIDEARAYDERLLTLFGNEPQPDTITVVLDVVRTRWTRDDQP